MLASKEMIQQPNTQATTALFRELPLDALEEGATEVLHVMLIFEREARISRS